MIQHLAESGFDSRHFIQTLRMPSGDASLAIQLDHPSAHFSNLDVVTGTLTVHVTNSLDVSSILVKLEGESRTGAIIEHPRDSTKTRRATELHKVLYKLDVVFPPRNILDPHQAMTGRHQFTIGPGIYQYRFTLKVPLNNTCHVDKTWSMPGTLPRTHYKSLLPPSLDITTGGLDSPAEVKIQYYVKAIITRPSLVRSNIRAILPIEFSPLSTACLQPNSAQEAFARRRHGFPPRDLYRDHKLEAKQPVSCHSLPVATHIAIEARMPHPSVLIPDDDLPLRLSCIVLQGDADDLHVDFLRLQIHALLEVRTQGSTSTHTSTTLILEQTHIDTKLTFVGQPVATTSLDDSLWRQARLPERFTPSFETCNVTQRYELHVIVGIMQKDRTGHCERIVSELSMPVKIESTIVPNADKVERLKQAAGLITPHAPMYDQKNSSQSKANNPDAAMFDAPPSYEDAIASGPKPPKAMSDDPYKWDRQASPC